MFGGIQGIMATDIHHKQSVLHCTIREAEGGAGAGAGGGDTEAEGEEEVKLVEACSCEQESKE